MRDVNELREQTYNEAHQLLDKYGKCAIIRPTGFGKTGLLTRFIASGEYKKVLYLYPAEVVKDAVVNFYHMFGHEDDLEHVEFMTYLKLTLLNEDDLKRLKDLDLIICDECHRLGAPETMHGLNALIENSADAHLLGATATPERSDMIDEIAMFFDDHITSKYTLHDAFEDGLIQRPYYCFCAEGASDPEVLARVKKDAMLETSWLAGDARKDATELISARVTEIANLSRMDKVLQDTLKEVNIDTTYQKYIVFFNGFKHIREAKKSVKRWFKQAFPDHKINELTVSSETIEYAENVSKLDSLSYKENQIDLIYSCNMLNMGYHVSSLTGIIMYRGTFSSICYVQQLGRALSTGDNAPKIVFDIVDNLHRKSVYSMLPPRSSLATDEEGNVIVSVEELKEYDRLVQKTHEKKADGTPMKLTKEEKERLVELAKLIKIASEYESGKRGSNAIYAEDLIVTSYAATYRELIAKTVAEPVSMRCRQAWARWIEKGGDASVMTKEYILGQKAPQAVPLPPFCKLKNVSINAVLDEMGVIS